MRRSRSRKPSLTRRRHRTSTSRQPRPARPCWPGRPVGPARTLSRSGSCATSNGDWVPSWAEDPKIGNRMINARAETVHEKPAFKRAFRSRRLLVPVDGFYEWFPTQQVGKSGKPLKQLFYIRPAEPGGLLTLAGLYEFWRDESKPADDAGNPHVRALTQTPG
ncbi:SOS response-associated peptidase family protein [Kribbella sp. NPDC023972]|uniref:SOS response-associated peptidase n=1 Tax=Kribbella sp. NPDC023972 TaxID=3154795 RepID=UPI0033EED056